MPSLPQIWLLICSQTREEAIPELHYYIRLKSLTGAGIKTFTAGTKSTDPGGQVAKRSGVYVCVSIPLSELGDPWAVFAGATVVGGGRVMDETAWQMIFINKP
jgi:hypothetical protein